MIRSTRLQGAENSAGTNKISNVMKDSDHAAPGACMTLLAETVDARIFTETVEIFKILNVECEKHFLRG